MSENQTFQRITNIRRIARVAIQTKKEPIFFRDVITHSFSNRHIENLEYIHPDKNGSFNLDQ